MNTLALSVTFAVLLVFVYRNSANILALTLEKFAPKTWANLKREGGVDGAVAAGGAGATKK